MQASKEFAIADNPIDMPGSPDLNTADDHFETAREKPAGYSLEAATEITRTLKGVELATLEPFDTIVIDTFNSRYRILLLDPKSGQALLEGGKEITEPLEVTIMGASLGGSILQTGWLRLGLRLEAWASDKFIRTSIVQSISVERQTSGLPSVIQ